MSLKYRDKNGAEAVICGLTPGGDLAFGASTTRSGTTDIPSTAAGTSSSVAVTFAEAMPDNQYEIVFHGTVAFVIGRVTEKTANGFTVQAKNISSAATTGNLDWYAYKLYDVEHAEQNASDIENIKAKIPSTASSSNKLATSKDVSDLSSAVDERLDGLEDAVPVDASITNQLVSTSTMNTALGGKQDTLEFDDTPTAGSDNPVTSDGIKDALDDVGADIDNATADIYEVIGKNGAKNLLPNITVSKSISGITYTRNSNGSVTINGTSTGWGQNDVGKCLLPKGTYTISVGVTVPSGVFFTLRNDDADSSILNLGNGGTETERDFTLASDTNIRLYCGISGNVTVSNITFYPMIRLASDTDSTYKPYTETNAQLMNSRMSYMDNGILGAKNLNSFPYYETSKISNGITFTVNDDGTVKADGTATAQAFFNMHIRTEGASDALIMKNGKYFLSGCPSGGSSTTYSVQAGVTKNSAYYMLGRDYGEGVEINVDGDDTHTGEAQVQVQILISNGATVSNLTFKPMLRLVTDGDSTYQPYAMSNQQVTEYLKTIIRPNLLDNPWFTVNQRDVSSFSTNGNVLVDRWGNNRAEGTISENGVTFAKRSTETSISYIYQRIENYSNIVGKTVTFSAIIDGDLYSVTGKFPVKNGSYLTKQITVGGDSMQLRIEFGSTSSPITYPWCLIWNDSYNNHTVKAAKLELGTVSTLANDTAPNYATELLKCQRYFQRLKTESTDMLSIGMGFAVTTTDLRIEFPISIHMRATPNVSYSGLPDFKYTQTVGSAGISPTNITAAGGQFGNGVVVKFTGTFTEGDIYEIYTLNGYIDLSADL